MTRCKLALIVPMLLALPLAAFVGPPVPRPQFPELVPDIKTVVVGVRDLGRLGEKLGKIAKKLGKPQVRKRILGLTAIAESLLKTDIEKGCLLAEIGAQGTWCAVPGIAAASEFGFDIDELKQGKVVSGNKSFFQTGYARAGHLYLGNDRAGLRLIAKNRSIAPLLVPSHRRALRDADLMLWVDCRMDRTENIRGFKAALLPQDDSEKKTAAQLVEAWSSLRYGIITMNVDDHIRFGVMAAFDGKLGPEARSMLKTLKGKLGASTLAGLPTGRVIFAHAAADGAKNAGVAKLLLRGLFQYDYAGALVSAADQPLVDGVFSTLWRRFKGRRLALYHNEDERQHGLFSLVAILDSDDPKKAMDEIGDLARFARGKDLDLSDKGAKGDAATVRNLVADLDHDRYAVRESATVKLALIGEPVLALLEQTAKTAGPEVRRRAERLIRQMKAAAEARRKEALSDAPRRIRPGFVLERGAETLDGHKVDVVAVKLGKEDAAAAEAMKKLAGPGWARVRMATAGKKVVVLVGSDTALFRQALKNVKTGAAGLEGSPALAAFRKQADRGRKLELHAALESVEALKAGGIDPKKIKAGSLSSLAVSVDEAGFDIRIWVTPEGFRSVAESWWWWRVLTG